MDGALDDEERDAAAGAPPRRLTVPTALAGARLDKALAGAGAPEGPSRSRMKALIEAGAVTGPDGEVVRDARRAVKAGEIWTLAEPPPAPARPEAEAIPLSVAYEDAHLIVVDKPAGMVVHPAPGATRGTLVNALLHHCGSGLSGIGGEARPGIVHRIDKDTSGLLVAAKTEATHRGLAALFAAHDVERAYAALCWGAPGPESSRIMGLAGVSAEPGGLRVEAAIARHPTDRKRMAVTRAGGRHAVTHLRRVGVATEGAAARLVCRLETGRTHQIRVHLAWLGHPLIGDPVYGRGRRAPRTLGEAGAAAEAFPRQALHAATLGFRHPATGEALRFEAEEPEDFAALAAALGL